MKRTSSEGTTVDEEPELLVSSCPLPSGRFFKMEAAEVLSRQEVDDRDVGR